MTSVTVYIISIQARPRPSHFWSYLLWSPQLNGVERISKRPERCSDILARRDYWNSDRVKTRCDTVTSIVSGQCWH